MKFGRPPAQESTMPLSSLLDVVLLLLIFFVVTSSFAERRLPLDLPSAETATAGEDEALVVEIDAAGQVRIEGEAVSEQVLDERLAELGAQDASLEIRADRVVQHGVLVGLLDRARRAGVARLGLGVASGGAGGAAELDGGAGSRP